MPRKKAPAHIDYVLPSGAVIQALKAKDPKTKRDMVVCPTCERRLPRQKAPTAAERQRYEKRIATLQKRLQEDQAHIVQMLNKTRKKLGQAPLTAEEVLAEANA